jgi:hypothetical protein
MKGAITMNTLHKSLADIRELRQEEIDLTGGAYSQEPTYQFCYQTIQYNGQTYTAIGDVVPDTASD